MSTDIDLLEAPVNVKQLVDRLEWDEDAFEDAVRQQPRLYLESCRYRALKARSKARAEFDYGQVIATERLRLRNVKEESGKKAYTEGGVADKSTTRSEAVAARKKLDRLFVEEELAKGIMECYRQRAQMLKIISDIRCSEVANEIRAVRENLARDEMKTITKKAREAVDRRV